MKVKMKLVFGILVTGIVYHSMAFGIKLSGLKIGENTQIVTPHYYRVDESLCSHLVEAEASTYPTNIRAEAYPLTTDSIDLTLGTCDGIPDSFLAFTDSTIYPNKWYATFCRVGLSETDSFLIKWLNYYHISPAHLNDSLVQRAFTVNLKIWEHDEINNRPGSVLWSYDNSPGIDGDGDYQTIPVNINLPGMFWLGYRNPGSGDDFQTPCFTDDPIIGHYTKADSANPPLNWDFENDACHLAKYQLYMRLCFAIEYPNLSSYNPPGWEYPIIPSTTNPPPTVLPRNLYAGLTYINDFNCVNISTFDAIQSFYNYLFLDGQSIAKTEITGLNSGVSVTGQTPAITIPGGRHTLLSVIDYTNIVPHYALSETLLSWGKQYVWVPENKAKNDYTIVNPPDFMTPYSGPHYNVTSYAITPPPESKWALVTVKKFNDSDTTNIDLRLYDDMPEITNCVDGLTNVIANSCLDYKYTDFIAIRNNGGNTYYPGIYRTTGSDSCYFIWNVADNDKPLKNGNWTDKTNAWNIDTRSIAYIQNISLNKDETFECSLKVALGNIDVGIAIFDSINSNYIGRSEASVIADANGIGGHEHITFKAPRTDIYGVAIWFNNLNKKATGTILIKGATGGSEPFGIEESEKLEVRSKKLEAYPNPFHRTTVIRYSCPCPCKVSLKIYNVTGRLVKTLVDEEKNPGYYTVSWDANPSAKGFTSGVYFAKLKVRQTNDGQAGNYMATKKIILLK